MDHSHIVAMIDSCLERLHAARRLLSTQKRNAVVEEFLDAAEARIAQTKKKVRPQISTKKKRRDELTASLFAPIPEVQATTPEPSPKVEEIQAAPIEEEVVAKQPVVADTPRKRLVTRAAPAPRKKAVPPVSALVGAVPSGPVFIPAAQMREKEAQKQTATLAERVSARQSDSAPLTAELLAQRWIQTAGF